MLSQLNTANSAAASKERRKRNEGLVLKNFLKEFHETMLETMGYSAVNDLVYFRPDKESQLPNYDLVNVQIEVNLIEVLWRLGFISPLQLDVEF